MHNYTERDFIAVNAGKWARISKEDWQHVDMENGVWVPVFQSLAVSAGLGISAFALVSLTGNVARAALAGGLVLAVSYAGMILVTFWWARPMTHREIYEAESAQRGQAEHSRVTVEIRQQTDGGYWHTFYRALDTDAPTLAAIAAPGVSLSKRGLMELGLDDTAAMRLLQQLTAAGLIAYPQRNAPATWTAAGRALCRKIRHSDAPGGGGGGGALETSATTSQMAVGEGEDGYVA